MREFQGWLFSSFGERCDARPLWLLPTRRSVAQFLPVPHSDSEYFQQEKEGSIFQGTNCPSMAATAELETHSSQTKEIEKPTNSIEHRESSPLANLPDDFPIEKLETHPYEYVPELFLPLSGPQQQKVLYAALMAFALVWFGAMGTVASLCLWWLPLRSEHRSQVFNETAWPGIITLFSVLCFAVGSWLMYSTYYYAEAISKEKITKIVSMLKEETDKKEEVAAAPTEFAEPIVLEKKVEQTNEETEVGTICMFWSNRLFKVKILVTQGFCRARCR
jgi:hypothetical protein